MEDRIQIRGVETTKEELFDLRELLSSKQLSLLFKILKRDELQCLESILTQPIITDNIEHYRLNHQRLLGKIDYIRQVLSLNNEISSIIKENNSLK